MSKVEVFYRDPREINTDRTSPFNNRITDEVVENVAKSILSQKVINPVEIDEYDVIVTGEIRRRGLVRARELAPERVDELMLPCKLWSGDSDERLERQTIENLHHYKPTSIGFENAVYRLWKTGRYDSDYHGGDKGYKNLGDVLGYSRVHIAHVIEVKEFRDEYLIPSLGDDKVTLLSTDAIYQTSKLSPEQRVAILTKLANKEMRFTDIPTYVKAAKRSPVVLESMLIGELDLDRAKQTLDIIADVEEAGYEVDESMIGELIEEVAKEDNIITKRDDQFISETIAVMTGVKSGRTVIAKSPLAEFRRIGTTVNRWDYADIAQLGESDLGTAKQILQGVRDRCALLLSKFFGEADIIVEAEHRMQEEDE